MSIVVGGHQIPGWRSGMKPLRKQQVDLVDMLLEGGVAGRVILYVIGGAHTFTGVEGDFRGLAVGLAARRPGNFSGARKRLRQGLVVVLGRRQQ